MASIHLPIRQLVEFLLRTGSIDSRFAGFDRANEGARIHRKLQKAAGEGYQAEVFLSAEREACGTADQRNDNTDKSYYRACKSALLHLTDIRFKTCDEHKHDNAYLRQIAEYRSVVKRYKVKTYRA